MPETTLYIGDSSTDMQTACNAGLTAIGVMWGFRSPEELEETGCIRSGRGAGGADSDFRARSAERGCTHAGVHLARLRVLVLPDGE